MAGKYREYTDQDFIDAVKSSTSIAMVLRKIGLRSAGGNYYLAKERIKKLKLDTASMSELPFTNGYMEGA